MSFTGDESQVITLTEGETWTENYRDSNPSATKAHFFGINKLNLILAQDGCVGIRVYYALDDDGAKQLVLVGVNGDEEDLYNGVLLEKSIPCPPTCNASSPLYDL